MKILVSLKRVADPDNANKVKVNGGKAAPLFKVLKKTRDAEGTRGPVLWNFEKFVVAPGGKVVARFNPLAEPTSDEVVAAIEDVLSA